MRFRRLLSLALALIVAGPLPVRADAAAAKDVATIGDCLRKQDKGRGSQEACLKSADIVAKVENRTTLKISRKSIFGLLCFCFAFQCHYVGP